MTRKQLRLTTQKNILFSVIDNKEKRSQNNVYFHTRHILSCHSESSLVLSLFSPTQLCSNPGQRARKQVTTNMTQPDINNTPFSVSQILLASKYCRMMRVSLVLQDTPKTRSHEAGPAPRARARLTPDTRPLLTSPDVSASRWGHHVI